MGTTLTSKNVDSIIRSIPKKGFTAKFWQDHRSPLCQGSGVGKALKALSMYDVPPSGDPSMANPHDLEAIVKRFEELWSALGKAMGKCGSLQKESKKFCEGFMKAAMAREKEAKALLKAREKNKQAQDIANAKTDKEMQRLKKEHLDNRQLVIDELLELDKRARAMSKVCDALVQDVKLATIDVKKLTAAVEGQLDGNGKLAPELLTRFEKGLTALQKKYNLPLHGANLKKSLPDQLKELQGLFPQYAKLDYAKKERMAAGKSIKEIQDKLKRAQATFKTYAEFHMAMAASMNSAR